MPSDALKDTYTQQYCSDFLGGFHLTHSPSLSLLSVPSTIPRFCDHITAYASVSNRMQGQYLKRD